MNARDRRFSGWRPLLWLVVLNAPFAVGHPGLPWSDPDAGSVRVTVESLWRAVAVSFVLLVGPGLAWASTRPLQERSPARLVLVSVSLSTIVFVALVGLCRVFGRPPSGVLLWNATWVVTNVLFVAALLLRRSGDAATVGRIADPPDGPELPGRIGSPSWMAGGLGAVAFVVYFWGATSVVPPQEDHDLEVQGTGYALLDRLEPLLLTDRGTDYYFAHPPLLHFQVAGSFLYFDAVGHLKRFDEATLRNLAARQGRPVDIDPQPFENVRVLGVRGTDYLVSSPEGLARIPVEHLELEIIAAHYFAAPHRLETRTPSVFFAAATVGLLAWWLGRLQCRSRLPGGTGDLIDAVREPGPARQAGPTAWLLPLAAAAAYATSPEVFVRSSYGGYFAISNFSCLVMLIAAARWDADRSRSGALFCLLAGAFAALANHKLVFLPLALGLCQLAGRHGRETWPGWAAWAARFHPTLAGFIAGTLLFWIYGLLVHPAEFWNEHVRTHLFDRLAQINPLGYVGYPSVTGLWTEFWQHTGYVLLPAGVLALVLLQRAANSPAALPAVTRRSWLAWFALTAAAFSVVDWRMTKHLMPLVLLLTLATAAWASTSRWTRVAAAVGFAVLAGWNVLQWSQLVADFESFRVTPAW